MAKMGRPTKEFDQKTFEDLVGIGCGADEICWFFRDSTGKIANIDTLSRWCRRKYGVTFQEFRKQNGAMMLKIKLRQNQLKLSATSAPMAIFLGKQYLGQRDNIAIDVGDTYLDRSQTIASLINSPLPDVDISELTGDDHDA